MNEKVAAGKLFSEYTNDERVNNSWRVPMKKKIVLMFLMLISMILIMGGNDSYAITRRCQNCGATVTGYYADYNDSSHTAEFECDCGWTDREFYSHQWGYHAQGSTYPETRCGYKKCNVSGCGRTDGWNHTWSVSSTTPATCAKAGTITYVCSNNKHTSTVTGDPATGVHTWGSWITIVSATCTTSGTEKRTCSVCSTSETRTISATGHSYSNATCTSPKTCTKCGATSGSELGHNYTSSITKPATCTSTGTKKYTCSRCGDSYTETISALGHSYTGSCPTCGTANVVCSRCGDVKSHTCTFTVSYNANGGSGAPSSQTKYPGTALTLSTVRPTRTGYNFLGWSTSSSATTATYQPGDSYTADSSATLYAVWELIKLDVTLGQTTYTYDGTVKVPSVSVKKDGVTLTLDTDYTVTYSNNTNAGTANVIVEGINNYAGQSVAKTFTITKRTLTVTVGQLTKEYGEPDPTFTYSYSGQVSGQTPAYTGSASRATGENIGSYAISKGTFDLKNNGTFLASNYNVSIAAANFTITVRDINKASATYQRFWKYTGSAIEPPVTLKDGSSTLTSGTDYTIVYSDNTAIGRGKLTITGKGNYTGTKTLYFTINESGAQYDEIVVDTTAPSITNIKAAGEGSNITVTATIADPASGTGVRGSGVNTSSIRYALTSSESKPSASSSAWGTSNVLTATYAGKIYIWVMAKDNVGNTAIEGIVIYKSAEDQYVEYVVDLTAPTISNMIATISGKTVTIGADIIDPDEDDGVPGSGVNTSATRYAITKTNTAPTETSTEWKPSNAVTTTLTGSAYAWIMAKDNVGNVSYKSVSVTLTKDITSLTISGVENEYTYTGSAITPEPVLKDGTTVLQKDKDYTLEYANNTNVGTATITVKGTGYYIGTTEITFSIIKANSTITVIPTSVAIAQGGSATITITYDGDGTLSVKSAATGIATATLSGKTVTVKGVAGGTTTITVSATAGSNYNAPTSVSIPVTVYGKPSAPTITASRTTWGNTDVTFTITGGTAPQGGQTLQYKIGNGEWTNYTSAVTVSTEGKITVYARAINTSSASLTSSEVSAVGMIDKTAPSTLGPTVSSTSNTITATCNQADNLATVNSGINASLTRYRLLASDGTTVVKDWQTSNTFTGLTVSTVYQVQTRVTDNAGNTSTSEIITKETTAAPEGNSEITITPTSWTNGNVTVTVTYPTIDGYTNKKYKIGSGNEQTYTASFTVSENTTVTAYLKDSVGNIAATATATITNIDKTKPTVTVDNVRGRTVTLVLTDNESGVNGYAVTTTNTVPAASSFTAVTAGESVAVTTKVTAAGTYYAWAKDVAGNISTATIVTVAEPILMTETYTNANTNKYILGNSTITQRRADIAIISIEDTLPTTLPSGAWDVSRDKNGSVYAWLTENVTDSTKYDLHIAADGNIIASSGRYLFTYYTSCTEIQGLNKLDTSNVTNMGSMFYQCDSLTSLDLSNFDTSKVTSMSDMFGVCSKLTNLDLSNFDVSKVTNMSDMFSSCSSLTGLNLSNFNTSKVTNMKYMFFNCRSLTSLDVSNFDTGNVTSMRSMFYSCISLTSLDVSNFNTSNVTNMTDMFYVCSSLTSLNVSNFDTSKVTSMQSMFGVCSKLTNLDLSNFDVSKVTNMEGMFRDCSSLTSIPIGLDLSNTAITSNDSTSNGYAEMFSGCSSLTSATINSKYIGYRMFYGCNKLTDITITSDVQGVYSDGTAEKPSGAFKYTNGGKLVTNLNSSSTAITKTNYDWVSDNRIFDADGPEITFTYYNNTTYAKSQSVKVTVTDMSAINTSSLKYIWSQSTTAPTESAFTSNGTAFTNEATITKSTDSGNNWYLWVIAKDEYGNTTIAKSNAVYLDNGAPTVTGASSIVYGSSITLTLKDNLSGVDGWQVTKSTTAPTSGWTAITATTSTTVTYTPTAVGTYYAWAKDKAGNVSAYASFTVTSKSLTSSDITASLEYTTTVYSGQAKTPSVTVKDGTKTLTNGTDYSVTYTNNTNVGTATVTITGKGNYAGTKTLTFAITSASLEVTASGYTGVYDGKAHGITVTAPSGSTISYGTTLGTYDKTTSPTYTNVGTYTVYYKVSRANYSDVTGSAKVIITAKSMTATDIKATLGTTSYTYDGTAKEPTVTVTENGTTLASSNYTVTYTNNKNVGEATVTITGKGNYTGNITLKFTITKRSLTVTPTANQSKVYGTAEPTLQYTYSGNVTGETPAFTGSLSRAAGSNVGEYNITQNTLALKDNGTFLASNYNLVFTTGVKFAITKATSTITLSKATLSINKGSSDTVTVTYNGDGTLSVSSSATGVATATISGSTITIKGVSAGTATITVSATAGTNYNAPTSKTITVTVYDKPTAPTITVKNASGSTITSGTWATSNLSITISGGTIQGAGEIGYKYSYNGSTWYVYNGAIAYTTDTKEAVIYAKAYNKSSETMESESVTYTIKLDKVAPTLGTVTTTATTSTITLKVTGATDATSGIKEYEFYVDGVLKATQTSATYTFTGLTADKSYEVGYKIRDNAGNVTALNTKTQSTSAISGTIVLTPSTTEWTKGNVIVTIEWPDITLTKQIKVGDGAWQNYSNTSYEITENTTIYARLTDGQNTGANAQLTIGNIDKTKPTVTMDAATYIYKSRIGFELKDTISGVIAYTITDSTEKPTTWDSVYSSAMTSAGVTFLYTGNVGKHYVWVKDQAGNISDPAEFTVTAKSLTSEDITITVNPTSVVYDGSEKTVSVTVKDKTSTVATTNYTVSYKNNINVGTATVVVTGKNNYTGTNETATFAITRATPILEVKPTSVSVTKGATATVQITYNGDGALSVSSANSNIATATLSGKTITVTGISANETTITVTAAQGNNYNAKEITFTVTVGKKSMASSDISVTITPTRYVYTGSAIIPTSVVVKDGNTTLKNGTDYTLSYSNNINVSTSAKVTVTGIGNYASSKDTTFEIYNAPMSGSIKITGTNKYGETLTANISGITPKNCDKYTYQWYSNTSNSTTGGTAITGATKQTYVVGKGLIGKYIYVEVKAEKANYETTTFKDITDASENTSASVITKSITDTSISVTLNPKSFIYDGSEKTPTVTVMDGEETLVQGTDYTVTFADNINVTNNAKATITGIGNYGSSRIETFSITNATITGEVSISGTPRYGETLTAVTTKIVPVCDSYTYQWYVGSVSEANKIAGETSKTYTVGKGMVGSTICVRVEASKANYTSKAFTASTSSAVAAKDISGVTVTLNPNTYVYDGKAKTPTVTVKDGTATVSTDDYEVAYSNNINASETATVVITGKNNYTGTKTIYFTITKATAEITLDKSSVAINEGAAATVNVTYAGDAKLEVTSNNAQVATASITGKVITISGIKAGTTTIVVSGTNGKNYNNPANKTISVTVYGAPTVPTITVTNTSGNVTSGTWSRSNLTIKISGGTLSGTGTIGYKYSYDRTTWYVYNGAISYTVDTRNAYIYAKAYNTLAEDMESSEVSFNIKLDKVAPTGASLSLSATTNTITAKVENATDATSGIKEYNFYLNGILKTTQTSNTYVYTGLEANKEYTIGYTIKDVAGNETTLSTKTFSTVEISSDITLDYYPKDYTNGNVTVTIEWPTTTLTKQISVGNANSWVNYSDTTYIVEANTTIYARLTDGQNIGASKSVSITNIDKVNPEVKVGSASVVYGNSINFTMTDNLSGVNGWMVTTNTTKPSLTDNWNVIAASTNTSVVYTPTAVGTYYVWVKDVANNISAYKEFKVTAKDISSSDIKITLTPNSFVYDGSAKEPVVKVEDNGKVITEYTVSYNNNINVGTKAEAIITGNGNYSGSKKVYFTITNAAITGSVSIAGVCRYGETLTAITDGINPSGCELTYEWYAGSTAEADKIAGANGKEYVIGSGLVGKTIYVVVTANKANYAEAKFTASTSGKVAKVTLSKPTIQGTYTYNGSVQTVRLNNFDANTMNIANNTMTNAGKQVVIISLKSAADYDWTDGTTANVNLDWTMAPKQVSVVWGTQVEFTYNGQSQAPTATVDSGVANETIVLAIEKAINAGKYVATATIESVTGGNRKAENYTLTNNTKAYTITSKDITSSDISAVLNQTTFEYDGKAKEPTATVKDGTKTLTSGKDYTLTYKNNVNVGTATAVITGINNYSGTIELEFTIAPASSVITVTPATIAITKGQKATATVTYNGDGELSIATNNSEVVSAVLNGRTITITGTNAGTAIITVSATAGSNHAAPASKTITVVVYGAPTKPTITVTNADGNVASGTWSRKDLSITIGGSGSDVGYEYSYDGETWTDYTGAIAYTEETATKTIYARAYNKKSKVLTSETVSYVIKLDKTAPTGGSIASITTANAITASVVGVNGNVSGVKEYEFYIDGTLVATQTSQVYSFMNLEPETNYVIGVKVRDNAGNVTTLITSTVKTKSKSSGISDDTILDTIAPSITLSKDTVKVAEDLAIILSDELSGVDGWQVTDNKVVPQNGWVSLTPSASVTVIHTPTRTGTYYVWAKDRAGNISTYKSFIVIGKDINSTDIEITIDPTSYVYDGTAKEPTVTVTDKGVALVKDTDYEVTYKNNVNAGTATVTIKGINEYSNEAVREFTITKAPREITVEESITLVYGTNGDVNFTYNGEHANAVASSENTEIATVTISNGVTTNDGTVTVTPVAVGNTIVTIDVPETDNYQATRQIFKVTVVRKDITNSSDITVILKPTAFEYDGTAKEPTVTVKDKTITLTEGVDYDVEFKDNIEVGTAKAIITGKGNYEGTKIENFYITDAVISGTVTIEGINRIGETLTANTDDIIPSGCTFTYQWYVNSENSTLGGTKITGATNKTYVIENGMAGKYIYVVVTASKTNYESQSFTDITDVANNGSATVEKLSIAKPTVKGTYTYNGKTQTVVLDGFVADLMNVSNNTRIDAGTQNVVVTLKDESNYKWENGDSNALELVWTIDKKNVSVIWGDKTSFAYNGKEQAPTATAESGVEGETLVITRTTRINVGDYTSVAEITKVNGGQAKKENYNLTNTEKAFTITIKNIGDEDSNIKVVLNPTEFDYDGTAKEPTVTVYDGTEILKEGTDYTVEFKDNVKAGQATAIISGKGNYGGTKVENFTINKIAPELKLDPVTISIKKGETATIQITYNGDGALSVSTDKDGIASATLSGKTITVTGISAGTVNVTVSASAGENYKEATSKTAVVTVYGAPTMPIITVKQGTTEIANGSWATGNVSITIGGSTLVGGGNIGYEYSYDKTNWTSYTGAIPYTEETAGKVIYARAYNTEVPEVKSEVAEYTIKLDKTAPVNVTIIATVNGSTYDSTWTKENVDTVFTATDNISGIAKILYSIDGGTTWVENDELEFTTTTNTTLRVKAVNGAGLESAEVTKVIKVDKILPVVDSVVASGITGRTEAITITATDADSGVYMYALTRNTNVPTIGWQEVNVFNVSENGTWYAWVKDNAGNVSIQTEKTVVTNTHVDRNSVQFEAVISTSNASGIYAKVGDTITLTLTSNKAIGKLPTVTLLGQTATITPSTLNGTEYKATVTVKDNSAEGLVTFIVTDYEDSIGNAGTDVTSTIDGSAVYVDRTLPTDDKPTAVSITENKIVAKCNQEDNASAVFNSGIAKTEFAIKKLTDTTWGAWQETGDFNGLELGVEYQIKTRVTDRAGNVRESLTSSGIKTKGITKDDIVFDYNPKNWTNGNVTVTIIWPDTTLDRYYKVTGETSWKAGVSEVIVENYGDTVYARLYDGTNEIINSITITNIDKIKPTVTATVPTNWTNKDKVITVTGTDNANGSGIAGYYITNDASKVPTAGEFIASTDTTYTFTKDMGTYYIWAIDGAGNISDGGFEIEVINIGRNKPVIEYVGTSKENVKSADTITVRFKGVDVNEITSSLAKEDLEFFVGGEKVTPTRVELVTENDGTPEINYTLTLEGISGNGTLEIKVPKDKVTNVAGNTNDETMLTTNITVDNTKPNPPVANGNENWTNEDVTITIETKADEEYKYSTDGGKTWEDVGEDGKITITDDGETEVIIKAVDKAGNESDPTIINTKIERIPPVVSFDKMSGTAAKSYTVEITVTEEGGSKLVNDRIYYAWLLEGTTPTDADYKEATLTNNKYSTTISGVTGRYILWVREGIKDNAGNESERANTNVFVLDNSKPGIGDAEVTVKDENNNPKDNDKDAKGGDKIIIEIPIDDDGNVTVDPDKIEITIGGETVDPDDVTIKEVTDPDTGEKKIEIEVDVPADKEGKVEVDVKPGAVKDDAGNENDEKKIDTGVTVDNTKPEVGDPKVTVEDENDNKKDEPEAKGGDKVTIELPVIDNGEVTVDPGKIEITIGGETVDPDDVTITVGEDPDTGKTTITIEVDVPSDKEGEIEVDVKPGAIKDKAGNENDDKKIDTGVNVDNTKPTMTIVPSDGNGVISGRTTNAEEITYTVTFDEVVKGFEGSDVVVTNGTVINVIPKGDGKTYDVIVSTIPNSKTTQTFKVKANAVTDRAGNPNDESETITISVDTDVISGVATIEIVDKAGVYANGSDTIKLTLTFTKVVAVMPTVKINDTVVTTSPSTTGSKVYTVTIAASALEDGEVTINVTGYKDEAGNLGMAITRTDKIIYVDKVKPSDTAPTVDSTTSSITVGLQQVEVPAVNGFSSGLDNSLTRYGISTSENGTYEWHEENVITELNGSTLVKGTTYYVKTKVTDIAGNETISNATMVTTKDIVGKLTLTPSTTAPTNQSVFVTIEDTLNSGFKIEYKVDNGEWEAYTGAPVEMTENGTVYARLKADDGQVSDKTASLDITNIDKEVATVTFTPEGNLNGQKTQTTKVNVTEHGTAGKDVYKYIWTTTNVAPSTIKTDGTVFASGDDITLKGAETGEYYLHVYVRDLAGNETTYTSDKFVVDNSQPIVTIVGPSKEVANEGTEVTYVITVNKDSTLDESKIKVIGEGSDGCVVRVVENEDGSYTVTVTVGGGDGDIILVVEEGAFTDTAGNVNDETTKDGLRADNTKPEIIKVVGPKDENGQDKPRTNKDGETTYEVTVKEDGTISVDKDKIHTKTGDPAEVTNVEVIDNGDGTHTLIITVKPSDGEGEVDVIIEKDAIKDEAGNGNDEKVIGGLVVDNTKPDTGDPTVTVTDENGNKKDDDKDAKGGDKVTIEIPVDDDGDVTVDPDKIEITIGGETVDPDDVDIKIDKDPDTGKTTITIDVNVPDDKEGEVEVDIKPGGIKDDAGNENDEKKIDTGVNVDNTKPVVTIKVVDSKPEVKKGDKVEYNVSADEDVTMDKSKITVDGGTIDSITENPDGSLTVIVIVGDGDGELVITAGDGTATDKAGNKSDSTSNSTIVVDNTAPVLNGATINNGAKTTDSVGVTIQIDANEDATYMYISNDSKAPNATDDGWVPFSNETLHELTQGDGDKTVYVWVKDNAGNMAGPATPTIELVTKITGNKEEITTDEEAGTTTTENSSDEFNIKLRVTDANFYDENLSADKLILYVGSKEITTATFTQVSKTAITNGYEYVFTVKGSKENGAVTIGTKNMVIRDKAGNTLTETIPALTTDIVADNTAPTMTVTRTANDDLSITVSDEHLLGVTVDGKVITSTNGTYTYTGNATKVEAIDKAGNRTIIKLAQ